MNELTKLLPDIILYIVSGFCFIKTYMFTRIYKENSDVNQILTSSLVIGFIICQIAFLIPISFGDTPDNICIAICSAILGFGVAKFINSTIMEHGLEKLKICRTANQYLWNDILDVDMVMEAKITIDGIIYSGKIHLIEDFSNKPHIVLADYSINGKNEKNNKIIILDTAKATEVVIKYNKNSPMIDKIKFDE